MNELKLPAWKHCIVNMRGSIVFPERVCGLETECSNIFKVKWIDRQFGYNYELSNYKVFKYHNTK